MLKKFYVEARKKRKRIPQQVKSRFGLCRSINSSRPEVDIINGTEFEESNIVFKAKVVDLKRLGIAKIEHKPPIASEDLKKLYQSESFNTATPKGKLSLL